MPHPQHNPDPILRTDLAGIRLRAPVLLAAGTAGTLDELAAVTDLTKVGALVTKSITPQPRHGNKPWRVAPLKAGMLNAVGLANPGLDAFLADYAPRILSLPCEVFVSVAGFSIDDYATCVAAIDAAGITPAIELNVSCPNVHGIEFGADPKLLTELIATLRPLAKNIRLIAKLPPVAVASPNSIADLARAAIDPAGSAPAGPNNRPGVDALTLCNTTPAMAINVRTRRPALANVTGGLSGPAVHPAVVRLVHLAYTQVCRDANIPILGLGGVMKWDDAAELILAGATAVQVGTVLFTDTNAPKKIAKGLAKWTRDQNASHLADLTGAVDLS